MSQYEKITLSKQDLQHVYGELLGRTMAKLDLHLPSTNSDPLKNQVATVLDDFLQEVFEMAKSAMVVDGVDLGESRRPVSDLVALKPKETVEPFDSTLNSTLRDILLQVEQETVALTAMRRELPMKARGEYRELVSAVDANVSRVLGEMEEERVEEGGGVELGDAVEDYERHVMLLGKLKRELPEVKMELDSFEKAVEFMQHNSNSRSE